LIKEIESDIPIDHNSSLMSLIGADRKEKINRLKNDRLKLMQFNSELTIKTEAAKDLSITPQEIIIKRTQLGKPYIEGFESYYFSLSHCDNLILFASNDRPVGADIEKTRSSYQGIAKRFFTANEFDRINTSECPEEEFLTVWTRKEAYVKLTGKGLSTPLDSFDVYDHGDREYITKHYISRSNDKKYIYSVVVNRQ